MLRMKWLCAVLVLGLAAGCQSDKKTQKEHAQQQWNSTRAMVLGSLAQSQYQNGNYDKARKTIDDAVHLNPESSSLRVLSAKLHIEQSELEAAQADLDLARKCDAKNAEADYLSGVIYQRWEKPQMAYDSYAKASEKAPEELAYVMAESEMLVALNRTKESLALLQSKETSFEHSGAMKDAIGQLLVQQGRYAEAAEALRQASILSPDEWTVREHLAMSLFYGKQYREAADVLTRLVQQEKYTQRGDLFAVLGECQMHNGRPRDARSSFETASRLNPGSAGTWLNLGTAALQLNDLRRAELSLQRALSLDPNASEGHLMLGYLRLRQNQLPAARSAFQKASALDRTDSVSVCMTGYVLQKMGHTEQAAPYYAQALRLKPNDELAAKLLASTSER